MDITRKLIIGALGTVLFSASSSFAAMPGQGWDVFGTADVGSGTGEAIKVMSGGYKGTSLSGTYGQGWDVFGTADVGSGTGEAIPEAGKGYRGTSMPLPSRGFDIFGSGSQDL